MCQLEKCEGGVWIVYKLAVEGEIENSPGLHNLKSIEKVSADVWLFLCSTLALGLVEEGIWVWAPELASLRA